MLSFDEGEEVFFDTADYLSSEEPVVAVEDLLCGSSRYEIWMNEPQSVKERRERFLCGMDFVEFDPAHDMVPGKRSEITGLERVAECSRAVPSSCGLSASSLEENFDCRMGLDGEANCMLDDLDHDHLDDLSIAHKRYSAGLSDSEQFGGRQLQGHVERFRTFFIDKNKMRSWWKHIISKRKRIQARNVYDISKPFTETRKTMEMKVQQNKKRCMEFTGVYIGQEISAHKGLIWTMKFSPDGQFLASGGEDGVVRIWRVTMVDASCKDVQSNFCSQGTDCKSSIGRKKSTHASIVIPDKVFWIEQQPFREYHGHANDVLDLAWSNSNFLLSSSMDNTVRLWHVDSNKCLSVFHHNNYVTCIQFNPADESHFISGSIDGKVRIWGVKKRRVVDWADVRDAVTAICYQPNGRGFVVGSISGFCRFYEASGSDHVLNVEICIHSKKKSFGNRITSIQFLQNNSQKVMITSKDSKVRILDGIDVVRKYRGLPKSGCQTSASFTSDGRHIVSVGEDSRIYVWNYDGQSPLSFKQTKSVRSCEHFVFEGVSVAIPWSSMETEKKDTSCGRFRFHETTQDHCEAFSLVGDSERFSLASWFSMDGSSRGCATWPQERLPMWDAPIADDYQPHNEYVHNQDWQLPNGKSFQNCRVLSAVWGLVIVTAGWDGMIRTFHNYGLPIRI